MTKVAVVGATGLLGVHLVAALVARGDDVVAVSRRPVPLGDQMTVGWEPSRAPLPDAAREGIDAIVNLAGAPIASGRWSTSQRAEILSSRVDATRGVVAALDGIGARVLVNASAVGYYGETEAAVDEHAPAGSDFLSQVCVQWERAAEVADGAVRVVLARSGVVLARDGGAYPKLRRAASLGVLGTVGSGRQWVPWIHVDDEVAALLHCLDRGDVLGPVNLVAPELVRQSAFAAALRHELHRPPAPPTPAVLVRAALGPAAALVLTGQQVVPGELRASGFSYRFPLLMDALADLERRGVG